jgi:glycerol-3-phosphate dehydrogenase
MLALAPRLVRPLALVLPDGRQTSSAVVADDARLVLTLIGEAERRGGVCANRLEAVEVVAREARITGVRLHDHERDGVFPIATAAVVDATGCAAATGAGGVGASVSDRPARGGFSRGCWSRAGS